MKKLTSANSAIACVTLLARTVERAWGVNARSILVTLSIACSTFINICRVQDTNYYSSVKRVFIYTKKKLPFKFRLYCNSECTKVWGAQASFRLPIDGKIALAPKLVPCFHRIEGSNARDQMNWVLHIPFILKGSPSECWLRTTVRTTPRSGLSKTSPRLIT